MTALTHFDLGAIAYEPAIRIQQELLGRVRSEGIPQAYLLLLEHDPPAITLGRRGRTDEILADAGALASSGVEVHDVKRGGQTTIHAPGQLVAYLIMDLRRTGCSLRRYVRRLEEAVIRTLDRFGVQGRRDDAQRGVWAGEAKIAAVGVAVSRWVTWHGLALNVAPEMSLFDLIVPCGVRGAKLTSMSQALGRCVSVGDVKPAMIECVREVFSFEAVKEGDAAQWTSPA